MRGIAYNRYVEEKKVIKRLSRLCYRTYWYSFKDINGILHNRVIVSDLIGTDSNFKFKTYTTSFNDSMYKIKYSPNRRGIGYWRKPIKTRESSKKEFLKILKENDIR